MTEGAAIPTLVLIAGAAVLAPLLAEWSKRIVPVPEVVIQILLGILLGPYVFGLAHPNSFVNALSDFGLTYLMFLAGTELDVATMRRGHLGRAAMAWGCSVGLALAVGAVLNATASFLTRSSSGCASRRQRSARCSLSSGTRGSSAPDSAR
jgi:Kef-type K+ transport system membrane component KefB